MGKIAGSGLDSRWYDVAGICNRPSSNLIAINL